MTTVFPWSLFHLRRRGDAAETPFQALLRAALATPHYSSGPERAALEWMLSAASTEQPEGTALPVAPVDLAFFVKNRHLFRNPRAGRGGRFELGGPWKQPGRVAAMAPWFPAGRGIRTFSALDVEELAAWRPQTLMAPVDVLRRLAEAVLRGVIHLPSLGTGIIALLGAGYALPEADDRDLFWEVFRVPVWTQWRGLDGELLAEGCEAGEDLHPVESAAIFECRNGGGSELLVTSLTNLRYPVLRLGSRSSASLNQTKCECGRLSSRLTGLGRLKPLQLAAAAVRTSSAVRAG